jgi:hypothetical protein
MKGKHKLLEEQSGRYTMTITAELEKNSESERWRITCLLSHQTIRLRISKDKIFQELSCENVSEVLKILVSAIGEKFEYSKREYKNSIRPLVKNTKARINSCALSFPVLEEGDDPPED